MSMVTVVTVFVLLFNDLGTAAAVIQRPALTDRLVSSIFWLNVGFGWLLTIAVAALAPLVAAFYNEPRITLLLVVMSFSFAISGLGSLQQALLQRDLNFQAFARVEMLAVLAGSLVGIVLAVLGAGVWSMAGQLLTIAVLRTALLWAFARWRPLLVFDWQEIRSIGDFSTSLTGFNLLNYFARNADNLLIARFLGAQSLGYYALAYRVMLYPQQTVSLVISRVTLPTYAQLQHDHSRFRQAYLKTVGAIALVMFPLMLGVTALAEPFVLVVFGEGWQPVILLISILAPVGMLQSIITTVGAIYTAKGRTDLLFQVGGAAAVFVILAFLIGLRWGIIGVASLYAIAYLVLTYPSFAIPLSLIELPMRELGRVLWRPLVCSLLMTLAVLALRIALPPGLSSLLVLSIAVPVGMLAYALASWLLNRDQIQELLEIVRAKL